MFDHYLALGDSMSIDYYPAQDAANAGLSNREEIGASSLLYSNDVKLFPEFEGKDLKTRLPGLNYVNLAIDGATTEDMLSPIHANDLKKFAKNRVLVTITIGGNDLLQALRRNYNGSRTELEQECIAVLERFVKVLDLVKRVIPKAKLLLTTVFDPTDGTGVLPSNVPVFDKPMPVEFLHQFNDHVRACAKSHNALLADIHAHFSGHGALCGSANNFWYWRPSPIEPSYLGASEIRRVWLETLDRDL